MPLKDRVCFKRGVLTAAIFAIAGFLLAFAGLCFAEPFRSFFTLPRLPGWYALRLCATPMEIGHGYAFFLPVTNAVVYAVIGFIIGLFSGSQRNATRFFCASRLADQTCTTGENCSQAVWVTIVGTAPGHLRTVAGFGRPMESVLARAKYVSTPTI